MHLRDGSVLRRKEEENVSRSFTFAITDLGSSSTKNADQISVNPRPEERDTVSLRARACVASDIKAGEQFSTESVIHRVIA